MSIKPAQLGLLALGIAVLVGVIRFNHSPSSPSAVLNPAAEGSLKKPLSSAAVKKPAPTGAVPAAQAIKIQPGPVTELVPLDLTELQRLSIPALWDRWQLLINQNPSRSSLETAALVDKLRKKNAATGAVYRQLAALLKDPGLPIAQKQRLVGLLGEVSTPPALGVLAQLWPEATDPALRTVIAEVIAQGPANLNEWELQLHPELAPVLDKLWQQADADQHLLTALAGRMAREGAPASIKQLLGQLQSNTEQDQPRNQAALEAMAEVRNPALIPLLKETLLSQAADSAGFAAAGTALSAIATVDSARVLLDWARQAPDQAATQVQQWLSTATGNDPDALRFVKDSLQKDKSFQSGQVEQAITAIMDEQQ